MRQPQNKSFGATRAIPRDSLSVDALVIRGNNNYSSKYIRSRLSMEPGACFAFEDLNQDIVTLAATDNFETLRYKVLAREDQEVLELTVREKANQNYLKLGLHYDNLYKTAGLCNLTRKKIISQR